MADRPSMPQDDFSRRSQTEYPEVISFEGTGDIPMLQHHIIALSLVTLGIVFAIVAPPGGYFALALFILIAAGYDIVFLRKSMNPVRISLYLRTNPVRAMLGDYSLGEIKSGTIVEDTDDPRELGYRPAPNRKLKIWTFDTEEERNLVAKRMREYLPLEA